MRISTTVLATGLALLSIVGLTGLPQSASASTETSPSLAAAPGPDESVAAKLDTLERTQSTWMRLGGRETGRLKASWAKSALRGAPGDALDLAQASGWDIGAGRRLLRVPFSDSTGLLEESNLSVVFDRTGAVIGSSAMALRSIDAQSGTLRVWTNGTLTLDRTVTEADVPPAGRSTWWGRFNDCLSNAGIASWVVTAITIACSAACSAACVVTVGAGCLVCAAAASGVASGTISYCIGKANRG